MKILITGCAGFIGFHLTYKILDNFNYSIFGIDNLNNYYDLSLKNLRIKKLKNVNKKFKFSKIDIQNEKRIDKLFKVEKFDCVINLAAQAGVRHSIKHPEKYFNSNIKGFFNILCASKKFKVKHIIFASTSSVYGNQTKFPIKEDANTDKPLSFYAASKKSNEVMAYSFSNIYKLPLTCLRFFTVYGPLGRPDMALYKFVEKISNNEPIELFNKGEHVRDFTYIDDVVNYIISVIKKPSKNIIPYQVLNVGSNKPKSLKYFLKIIQKNFNKKVKFQKKNLQIGDVYKTHADNTKLIKLINKKFYTPIDIGIKRFIKWYNNHQKY
tara:strand:+ start:984 stop:1955 length:972 start_codon:yes stop_codon:yes gene_type:complete